MDWGVFAVQWIHVFLGIFWFGAVLSVNFIIIPGVNKMEFAKQRDAVRSIASTAAKVITPISGLVILFGFLRGTLFGQVKSFDTLTTPYGLVWAFSLLLAIGLFFWGILLVAGGSNRFFADDAAWESTDGKPNAVYARHMSGLRTVGMLELLGFLVLFTCMILMRFGVSF